MKRLIIILAIVACASIAQAQSRNRLFSPFYDSMRIAVPMVISERAREAQQSVIQAQPQQVPEIQYVYTEDGHLIMFVPTGPGTFHMFKAW